MNPNQTVPKSVQAYQSKEEPEKLYALAGRNWRTMLTIGVSISILATAGGAYMLVMTFLNMNLSGTQSGTAQNLNRNDLSRVVGGLSERQKVFGELQNSSSTVADPSK